MVSRAPASVVAVEMGRSFPSEIPRGFPRTLPGKEASQTRMRGTPLTPPSKRMSFWSVQNAVTRGLRGLCPDLAAGGPHGSHSLPHRGRPPAWHVLSYLMVASKTCTVESLSNDTVLITNLTAFWNSDEFPMICNRGGGAEGPRGGATPSPLHLVKPSELWGHLRGHLASPGLQLSNRICKR